MPLMELRARPVNEIGSVIVDDTLADVHPFDRAFIAAHTPGDDPEPLDSTASEPNLIKRCLSFQEGSQKTPKTTDMFPQQLFISAIP